MLLVTRGCAVRWSVGRRRVPAVLATGAALVVLAGCSSSAGDGTSAGPGGTSAGTVGALQRATFGQFVFRFPAAWHAVDATFATGAIFGPLGWVTNREPGAQCTPDSGKGGHISCHPPIDHLAGGDVLVTFAESGGAPVRNFHANATIDGRPAQRTPPTDSQCSSGGRVGVDVLIHEDEMFLRITTCFGADATTAAAQVDRMLSTATFRG